MVYTFLPYAQAMTEIAFVITTWAIVLGVAAFGGLGVARAFGFARSTR